MTRFGPFSIAIASSLALLFSAITYADYDVDDSDSLDFESFHTDKKSAIKIYQDKQTSPKKVYQDTASKPAAAAEQTKTSANTVIEEVEDGYTGIYEIRERYTLGKSAHTPYSAFFVIESLHKQMAELCPKGWEKQREWSVAIDEDFYLHYQFRCL